VAEDVVVRLKPPETPPKSVVGRALTIIAAFEAGPSLLSLAELTRRTGLPKPTVHRLAAELCAWGLLEREGSCFQLGTRLFELGQLAPVQRTLNEAAHAFLEDLREATHQTIHLAIPDGVEVLYVEKFTGRDGPDLPSRVGGRMPMHCTGVGKALLAFSDPALFDRVVRAGLTRRTARTIIMPGYLSRELARVRRDGIAYEREESTVGVQCAACPVLDDQQRAVAAISVSGWSSRMKLSVVGPAIRTAALGLSRELAKNRPSGDTWH
jgi:IclR family acetate operon transcriptional repressor